MFNQLKKRGSILTGHNRKTQITRRRQYLLRQRQQIILQQQRIQQQRIQQEKLQQEKLQQEKLQQEKLQQEKLQQENLQKNKEKIKYINHKNLISNINDIIYKNNYSKKNQNQTQYIRELSSNNINKYSKSDITLILPIKDNRDQFKLFIKYYKLFGKGIKLLIIEFNSNNMLCLDNINNNDYIYHTVINNDNYNYNTAINYGILFSNTKYNLFINVNIILTINFCNYIELIINSNEIKDSIIEFDIFNIFQNDKSKHLPVYLCNRFISNKYLKNYSYEKYSELSRNSNIDNKLLKYPTIPIYLLHY